VTDSGDGGEGGGDELPCATEGEGGEDRNASRMRRSSQRTHTVAYVHCKLCETAI